MAQRRQHAPVYFMYLHGSTNGRQHRSKQWALGQAVCAARNLLLLLHM